MGKCTLDIKRQRHGMLFFWILSHIFLKVVVINSSAKIINIQDSHKIFNRKLRINTYFVQEIFVIKNQMKQHCKQIFT